MSKTVDEVIAYRILYILVTPFDKTNAYKYGIIDKEGNPLKKSKDLTSSEEKESYTSLHRLVFSLKRLLAKVPGGSTNLASLIAAYRLVKESYQNSTTICEEEFIILVDLIEQKKLTLVEEEIDIQNFIAMMEDGGAAVIVNTTGAPVATDKPAVRLNKNGKPISGILGSPNYMYRRKKLFNEANMKTFNQFQEESLSSYRKHKIRVKVSKDGGEKHHVDVKVFADSEAEAKGKARFHLKSKGYDTHSATHQGIDYSWLKKEEVEQIDELSNDHYAESEAHLNKASKALEISDMAAHHFHMSNHHEAKGRWHEEKGRHSSADREYAKAEEHHEKSMKPNNSKSVGVKEEVEQVNELSSDTLQSYKEKARKSADDLTAKGDHKKSLDRTMFRMRATGKQIDKTTAGIKKALNKEDVDKGEYDYEGQMARTQLQTTLRNCEDLIDMIGDDDNMPEWVQSKITLAQDYITTVRDYLQSKEELGEGVKSPGVGWMIKKDEKLKAIIDAKKEKMKLFKQHVGTKIEDKK